MTPAEAPKVEDLKLENLNQTTQEFQDNLKTITESVNKSEDADKIPKILTSCFQEDLQKLYATDKGKAFVTQLNTDITEALTKTIDQEDQQALTDLQILIKPLTMTLTETTTTYQNGFSLEATNTGSQLDYNTKLEGAKKYLPLSKQELEKLEYKDLPGKDKLLGFLTNPTKENIQKLQEFLYSRLTNAAEKTAFEKANKIKGTNEMNEKKRDGAFGTNTQTTFVNYLSAYLKDFKAFKPETKSNKDEIAQAQLAADGIAQKGSNLETASIPSKNPADIKEDTKDKNVAKLTKEVGKEEEGKLIESENFKLLSDKLQRKISRVLKIETKDENIEQEISDIDKKITAKQTTINNLKETNTKNQATIGELTKKINSHPGAEFRTNRQAGKDERKPLQKSINENISTIEGLTTDIADLNYDRELLVDQSNRLDNRFENKIVRINKVLASDKKILKDKITKYKNDTDVKETVDKRKAELAAINAFEAEVLALLPEEKKNTDANAVNLTANNESTNVNTTTTSEVVAKTAPIPGVVNTTTTSETTTNVADANTNTTEASTEDPLNKIFDYSLTIQGLDNDVSLSNNVSALEKNPDTKEDGYSREVESKGAIIGKLRFNPTDGSLLTKEIKLNDIVYTVTTKDNQIAFTKTGENPLFWGDSDAGDAKLVANIKKDQTPEYIPTAADLITLSISNYQLNNLEGIDIMLDNSVSALETNPITNTEGYSRDIVSSTNPDKIVGKLRFNPTDGSLLTKEIKLNDIAYTLTTTDKDVTLTKSADFAAIK